LRTKDTKQHNLQQDSIVKHDALEDSIPPPTPIVSLKP